MASPKFSEGDRVIGNSSASGEYCVTIEGWIGTVDVAKEGNFRVIEGFDYLDYDNFDLYVEPVDSIDELKVKIAEDQRKLAKMVRDSKVEELAPIETLGDVGPGYYEISYGRIIAKNSSGDLYLSCARGLPLAVDNGSYKHEEIIKTVTVKEYVATIK